MSRRGTILKSRMTYKIKKSIALSLVLVVTLISTIIPAFGKQVEQRQISQWSIGTLNEGENYGIYPLEWYDEGFREGISGEKATQLLMKVEAKLSELGFELDHSFVPIAYEDNGTRRAVLTGLYNGLAAYKLPEELESEKGKPIEYMQKRSILNGTNKGLELEEIGRAHV